ncbi:MAG: 50S ribosomal protein L21 [Bacteriovoracaceae bacterium]
MFGIVEIKGHQYRVSAGDVIDVEKMDAEVGSLVDLNKVLFIGGNNPLVGMPVVSGANIKAKVVRQDRDRKIIIFKRKPGSWRRKKGHRQHFTCLVITEIADGKGNVAKIDAASKSATKFNIK